MGMRALFLAGVRSAEGAVTPTRFRLPCVTLRGFVIYYK